MARQSIRGFCAFNMGGRNSGAIGAILLVTLAMAAQQTQAANILGLFASHSPSHLIIHMSVAKALAERGHNVTVVSSLKPTVTHKDITVIVIPPREEHQAMFKSVMKEVAATKTGFYSTFMRLLTSMSVMIEHQYEMLLDERFKRLYDQEFDLVILGFFINEFQMGVAAKFKCPIIIDWMQASMALLDQFVGNPQETSYVPVLMSESPSGTTMDFVQRLSNYFKALFFKGLTVVFNAWSETYYNRIFGNEIDFPSLAEMRKNVSLLFTSSHSHSEGPIRALGPTTIEIGGIQIKDKPDPLPKDIADFLNKADHGAILLSLGSNIKSTAIKPEIMQSIFKALKSLKQHVIWKWDDLENTPGNAPNILYKKWMPQDDILAHPKIKLFITHAGKGGTTEAQYHGVPMVALPIFADQLGNAKKIEQCHYGVSLELLSLNEADLRAAVLKVLNDPTYARNIKEFSSLYRDRPLTAKQNVVFWTEYVLRHHGAPHLQSPAVHMGTIAYYNLDVYAFLLSAVALKTLLTWFIGRLIWRKVCRAKGKQAKTAAKVKKN